MFRNELDRCSAEPGDAARQPCLEAARRARAALCTPDLDARVAAALGNAAASAYAFVNNFFDKCPEALVKAGFCAEAATLRRPQFRDAAALDFRVVDAARQEPDDGFRHQGAHYVEERFGGAAPPVRAGKRWNIEMLLGDVARSRGETWSPPARP